MLCINPDDPRFKEILKRVGNPILAEIEYKREIELASKTTLETEFTLADKIPPIEQNFEDDSPYKNEKGEWKRRTMRPEFKGKSTMDLVISGDRTRTTRTNNSIQEIAKAFGLSRLSELKGKVVRMTDKEGRKVYARITGIYNFTQQYQDATWQKEGWTKDVTDRLVGKYPYAIEFQVVSTPSVIKKPFKDLPADEQIEFLESKGYKISQKNEVFSINSPIGVLSDTVFSLTDAITLSYRDYQRFVENKEVYTDPQNQLESNGDIFPEVDPVPVYIEVPHNYHGQPVTIYLQEGIPVGASIKQSDSETNIGYLRRVRKLIEHYKENKGQIKLDLEPQGPVIETSSNDNPTKTLEGEQIDAYNKIQEWLNRSIPVTGNKEKDFFNHAFFLSGPGGSGKTYISEVILQGRKATIAAPTHQAKGVLGRNFKVEDDEKLVTAQKLLGLKPQPNKVDLFFSPLLSEVRTNVMNSPYNSAAASKMPNFFKNTSGIFLIDEASMIGFFRELSSGPMTYFDEDVNSYVTREVLVEPDLGKLMMEFSKIYYDLNGFYPKILFTGDVAQTPPIGVPNQQISILLKTLVDSGVNYAELTKIRRSDNEGVKVLLEALRNEIITALKKPEGQRFPDYMKVFREAVAYEDEWQNFNNKEGQDFDDFLDKFIELYKENIENFKDPEFAQYINYNSSKHSKTQNILNQLLGGIFEGQDVETMTEGDLIYITNSDYPAMYKNGSDYKAITLLKDTKMFVTKVTPGNKEYVINTKRDTKKIIIPIVTVQGNVYHHEEGDGKTPIPVELVLTSSSATEAIKENMNKYSSGDRTKTIPLFADKPETALTKQQLTLLSQDLGKFEFGLIVNNYKIQGSGVKNPFVDIYNMMTGHGGLHDALHVAMFIYTGISRTREKLYTFFPGITPTINPGTRPICG